MELRTGFALFAVVKVQECCAQGLLFSRGYSYHFEGNRINKKVLEIVERVLRVSTRGCK